MGQDQLDKYLKEQLGNHQTPIDSDALWSGIQAQQQQDIESVVKARLENHTTAIDSQMVWNNISCQVATKPNYGKIALTMVFLLIIGSTIGIMIADRNKNVTREYDTNSKAMNMVKASNGNENYDSKKTIQSSTSEGLDNSETQLLQSNPTLNNTYDNSNTLKNNFTNNTNASLKSGTTLNDLSASNIEKVIDNSDYNLASLGSNNKATSTDILNQTITNRSELNNNKTIASSSNSNIRKSTHSLSALHINKLDALSNQLLSPDDFLEGLPAVEHCFNKNKSVECYDYSPKKILYALQAYTTADYYNRALDPNAETSLSYLDSRKNTQKVQISNRTGLLLKIKHRKGIYIKTGVEAGFLREKFTYTTRDTVTEILPDQLINIHISNGDTILTYGNAPVTTISSKNWRVNNTFSTIGIPILVGYEKEYKKFSISGDAGVLYNIHRKFEGWLLGQPNDPVDAQSFFTTTNDVDITCSFNLSYYLNERFRLFGLASLRQNLNNINQIDINDINQKNTTYGLGLGIEFKI
jgi:hypothetical protein